MKAGTKKNKNGIIIRAICIYVAAYIIFGLYGILSGDNDSVKITAADGVIVQMGGTLNCYAP